MAGLREEDGHDHAPGKDDPLRAHTRRGRRHREFAETRKSAWLVLETIAIIVACLMFGQRSASEEVGEETAAWQILRDVSSGMQSYGVCSVADLRDRRSLE